MCDKCVVTLALTQTFHVFFTGMKKGNEEDVMSIIRSGSAQGEETLKVKKCARFLVENILILYMCVILNAAPLCSSSCDIALN